MGRVSRIESLVAAIGPFNSFKGNGVGLKVGTCDYNNKVGAEQLLYEP